MLRWGRSCFLIAKFIVSITGLLFWITQNELTPVLNLLLLCYFSADLYNNLNAAVMSLLKGLITFFACNYKYSTN